MQQIDARHPLVMRAARSAYWILGTMAGAPFTLSIVASTVHRSWLRAAVICLVAMAVSFLWLGSFKLVLTDEVITYRTFLGGTSSIRLDDIHEVVRMAVRAGGLRYADRFKPPIRLVIVPRASAGERAMAVNLKVFNRREVAQLLEALDGRLQGGSVQPVPSIVRRRTQPTGQT